jgi:hypothetical protein
MVRGERLNTALRFPEIRAASAVEKRASNVT